LSRIRLKTGVVMVVVGRSDLIRGCCESISP
jgi:hypothetical protein